MAKDKEYIQGFEEYIRQGEPQKQERGRAWQTAIGLQEVDGLKTSPYLLDTARKHIEGDITIDEAKQLIDSYYKSQTGRKETEDERTEEADKVSARITELLQEQTFNFSPAQYAAIHRRLFEGIFKFAGVTRNVVVRNSLTGEQEIRPINEIASSHMARRTFVGNIYKKFKDQSLVSELSGHAPNSAAFARYREVDEEMKREMVSAID